MKKFDAWQKYRMERGEAASDDGEGVAILEGFREFTSHDLFLTSDVASQLRRIFAAGWHARAEFEAQRWLDLAVRAAKKPRAKPKPKPKRKTKARRRLKA